jgi:hypothetical protein
VIREHGLRVEFVGESRSPVGGLVWKCGGPAFSGKRSSIYGRSQREAVNRYFMSVDAMLCELRRNLESCLAEAVNGGLARWEALFVGWQLSMEWADELVRIELQACDNEFE